MFNSYFLHYQLKLKSTSLHVPHANIDEITCIIHFKIKRDNHQVPKIVRIPRNKKNQRN